MSRRIVNQFGRSMIEMLGVLAVIGVLTVGGIAGWSHAMRKAKHNKTREQITQIITGVKTYFAAQGNFDGLDTALAIQMGIIPEDMVIDGGNNAKTIYNGDIRINATIDPLDGKPLFMVVLTDLPKDAAMDLSTANWKDTEDLVQIDLVNGNTLN